MFFGFRNWLVKLFLLVAVGSGFVLLFMTVSRISIFVLLLSLVLVLVLHKKKLAILGILSLFVVSLIFLSFSTSLLERFGNTLKHVDILVNAKTGEAIGQVKRIPSSELKDKTIKVKYSQNKNEIDTLLSYKEEDVERIGTDAAFIILPLNLPSQVPLVVEPNNPTGENLPQGTGYVNLALAPIKEKVDTFFYQKSNSPPIAELEQVLGIRGNFLIKNVVAYDLSFTTRFQGEWPHALMIFKKDIWLGGGYSATGLAVDNNYLRILGEVGLLGFISYFGIFLVAGIYIKKILPEVKSQVVKSFVFGFIAGSFGLILNAMFIDVFEASKIAYIFWLLVGVILGTLHLYEKKEMDIYNNLIKTITSTWAIIICLFIAVFVSFIGILDYYFVGDDFTWFRWAASCSTVALQTDQCGSIFSTIISYFTQAEGFFYRPGTKLYFLLMYSGFWLNQTAYHMVSVSLHFIAASLLFFVSRRLLKDFFLSASTAFLFIILSGYSETIFWISSTGFLFNAVFVLLGLLLYALWKERNNKIYFILSLISISLSLLFHELGVISPLIILLYDFVVCKKLDYKSLLKRHNLIIFSPLLPYLMLRFFSQSHWFSGDYSYNLLKLPYNLLGNIIGYFSLSFFGPTVLPLLETLRNFSKGQVVIVSFISIVGIYFAFMAYKVIIKRLRLEEKQIIVFSVLFFIISLLPFLGLGNISSRYSYLSSAGFILLFVFCLKKIYIYLNNISGRNIAIASLTLIVGIFSLFHIIQLQKIQGDWYNAGEKVKKFVTAMNGEYTASWTRESMYFYFVNIPIKTGDAWVFPVGLNDAVWFISGNNKISVYQMSSLDEAVKRIENPLYDKVYEFDSEKGVIEREKPAPTPVLIPHNK